MTVPEYGPIPRLTFQPGLTHGFQTLIVDDAAAFVPGNHQGRSRPLFFYVRDAAEEGEIPLLCCSEARIGQFLSL